MSIEDYAWTKQHEIGVVSTYQNLQTSITTDILTLEIISHTPILTNSTTEITLEDSSAKKTDKQLAKEKKSSDRRIKKAIAKDLKHLRAMEKAEEKAIRAAKKKKQ